MELWYTQDNHENIKENDAHERSELFITDPSKWKDITPDMYDEINAQIEQTFEEGCHGDCSSCQSDCDHRESAQLPRFAKRMYAVNGGKGAPENPASPYCWRESWPSGG